MTFTITANLSEVLTTFKTLKHQMSKEEVRYYLCGICLNKQGEVFTAISTDGHKLGKLNINSWLVNKNEDFNIILEGEFILNISKIKPERSSFPQESIFTVNLEDKKISFSYPGGIINGNLIDGNFPDTQRVMPDETKLIGQINFNAQYMIETCKAMLENSETKTTRVTLKFDPEQLNYHSPIKLIDERGGEFLVMPMR